MADYHSFAVHGPFPPIPDDPCPQSYPSFAGNGTPCDEHDRHDPGSLFVLMVTLLGDLEVGSTRTVEQRESEKTYEKGVRRVLSRTVCWHLQDRVFVDGNRTVVFE